MSRAALRPRPPTSPRCRWARSRSTSPKVIRAQGLVGVAEQVGSDQLGALDHTHGTDRRPGYGADVSKHACGPTSSVGNRAACQQPHRDPRDLRRHCVVAPNALRYRCSQISTGVNKVRRLRSPVADGQWHEDGTTIHPGRSSAPPTSPPHQGNAPDAGALTCGVSVQNLWPGCSPSINRYQFRESPASLLSSTAIT